MRSSLRWILGASVALSAWAILDPARTPAPVVEGRGAAPRPTTPPADTLASRELAIAASPLPEHWPSPTLEPASRNPFVAPAPPPQKVFAPAPPPPAPAPIVEQPPANYRFWGRMTAPDGHRLLMLARGDAGAPVAIDAASRLEDGWAVESVDDIAVVLVHTASQRRERIPIPAEARDASG